MFVWRAKTILANLQQFLPEATEPLRRIAAAWDTPAQEKTLQEWFPKLPKISIDYAVMEKADRGPRHPAGLPMAGYGLVCGPGRCHQIR